MTNNVTFKPSKDSDWPMHPSKLIKVFAVGMAKATLMSSAIHLTNSDVFVKTM